jgi:hypothetical protein
MGLCIGCAIADGVFDQVDNRSANFFEPGGEASSVSALNGLVTFG